MIKNGIVEEDKITHVGGGLNISFDKIFSEKKVEISFFLLEKISTEKQEI